MSAINARFPFRDSELYRNAISSNGETEIYTANLRPYLAVSDYEPCITFVRKINSIRQNKPLGVLIVDIPYSKINKLFTPLQLNKEDNIYVIDSSSNIIFKSLNTQFEQKEAVFLNYQYFGKESSGKEIQYIGDERVLIAHSYANVGWQVVSIDRMKDLISILNNLRNRAVILILLALLLGLLLAYLFSFRLTKDISFLQKKMKDFREGNLNNYINWSRKDEIGSLAQSYNEMIKRIDDLINQNYVIALKEKDSKFYALQAQINPHFLYNTLDSISSIALLQHVPIIYDLSKKLSDSFRYCISSRNPKVLLAEELNHIESYLAILNIRYGDKFNIIWDIDPQTLSFKVLRLTIQPLVENAIYHGLEMKIGKGLLQISSKIKGEFHVINIIDDGLGIEGKLLAEIQEELLMVKNNKSTEELVNKTIKIGLLNVQERICLHYGNKYGIDIDSNSSGTRVTITLPLP